MVKLGELEPNRKLLTYHTYHPMSFVVRWLLVHRSFNCFSVIGGHVIQSINFLAFQKIKKQPPILLLLSCDTWWWVTAGYHGEKIQACLYAR